MGPTFRLVATLLLGLALTGPAAAARPAFTVPDGQLPPDAAAARAQLARILSRAAPGSLVESDVRYVLRLDRAHLRPGQPAGRRATVARTLRVNAWYYARWSAPDDRAIIRDPDGLLSTYWEGRGFALNPIATVGRWQGLNADLPPERLAAALLPYGVARRSGGRAFRLWEYYDVPDRPGLIRPGASGMAQGRIAQLMGRAYHETAQRRYADAAWRALKAFTVGVDRGGVRSDVAPGRARDPWYVERAYPGASPWRGAALNGFMVTLLNLHAAVPLLSSRPVPLTTGPRAQRARPRAPGAVRSARLASSLARGGERTLRRYLLLHDTGSWSLYGLLTPGWAWRTHIADRGYHCYHVTLLRQLQRQAPSYGFGRAAERWRGYARRAGVSCGP